MRGDFDYFERDPPGFEESLNALAERADLRQRFYLRDERQRRIRLARTKNLLWDTPLDDRYHLPRRIDEMIFVKTHLSHMERFTVVCFMLQNHVPPVVVRSFFELGNYDQSAWRQINWLLSKWGTPSWRWKQWEVTSVYNKPF
jgi:hypothetical protein